MYIVNENMLTEILVIRKIFQIAYMLYSARLNHMQITYCLSTKDIEVRCNVILVFKFYKQYFYILK